jgi:hypothetical protein
MPAIPNTNIPGEKSYRLIKPITTPKKKPLKGRKPVKATGDYTFQPKPVVSANKPNYNLMAKRMNNPKGFYNN